MQRTLRTNLLSPLQRLAALPGLLRARVARASGKRVESRVAEEDRAQAEALAGRVTEIESAGNATLFIAATGALGPGQFIEETWLRLLARHRPDLAGLPRAEQLAKRIEPALAHDMVVWLLVENAGHLRAAGLSPTDGHLYLAHFLGLPAALRTLKATPATPIIELVGSAPVANNPDVLEGQTAREVIQWAERCVRVAALRARSKGWSG